jgi:aspartate/methionine/tyrosine aminotransferase
MGCTRPETLHISSVSYSMGAVGTYSGDRLERRALIRPHRGIIPFRSGNKPSLRCAMSGSLVPRGTSTPSGRILGTDDPIVAQMRRLVQSVEGTASLAQGIVYYPPPDRAMERVEAALSDPNTLSVLHGYGADEGIPELRDALRKKLRVENGLKDCEVFVTHGAQQAFANVVISLMDADDLAVLFAPYYFNHKMAIQMCCSLESVIIGPYVEETLRPDIHWFEELLEEAKRTGKKMPKMVVLVNPSNPTGVMLSKEDLERVSSVCKENGVWLVVDNTYEHFVYDGRTHHCVGDRHVVNIFSFSKAFGMMGWRQGYLAYDHSAGFRDDDDSAPLSSLDESNPGLGWSMLKVQDTVPICATILSQYASIGALEAGREWVEEKVALLDQNRREILKAVECLGPGSVAPSEGAIYVFCKLPSDYSDDQKVVEWLVHEHKVCVIPGSSCGAPGYIRIAFGNLVFEQCEEAAARLKRGLEQLLEGNCSLI